MPDSKPVHIRLRPSCSLPKRSLDQRLAVRFPVVMAQVFRAVLALPARSRLRQAVLRRVAEQCVGAYNRRDYDALLTIYHPGVEVIVNEQMVGLGLEPVYRGRDGVRRYHERWTDEWGDWQMAAEEVLDFGDGRTILLGRVRGRGTGSGAAIDSDFGNYTRVRDGLVIREQFFLNRAEALKAARQTEK